MDALRPLVTEWRKKVGLAKDRKKADFQDAADACMRFLDGPYDWLYSGWKKGGAGPFFAYDGGEDALPGPSTKITVNKTAELVQLFGPALYHRNPVRKVNPRVVYEPAPELFGDTQTDPVAAQMYMMSQQGVMTRRSEDAARAELLEKYLNYTPNALNLKDHARWAIDEALIKGMGCFWTDRYQPAGGQTSFSASFYDSVDNLQIDPDAEMWSDIKWIARRCCHHAWEVEREYGLPAGSLKKYASLESAGQQGSVEADPDGDYKRKRGETADLVTYWKVWSKMGMGGRLSGVAQRWAQKFDVLGDNVYLVLCEDCPYPLNLPPPLCDMLASDDEAVSAQAIQEAQARCSWSVPYWADDSWPLTTLYFHPKPRKVWPMSHLKPGLGELEFLNWAWSFLASKVKVASRDFIAVAKSAGEELKDRLKHAPDYTLIEVEAIHQSIDQVVKFLQHPGFNPEIYKVIEGVTLQFERRVGLTELMYGLSARQMRSAQEATIKSDMINVRPDDMANRVEDAMTELARKEAFAARWHLRGPDVARVLGDEGAAAWEALVVPTDPAAVLWQLEYRIEANSARKPNRARDEENAQQSMQTLFAPLFQYAQMTGDVGPVNALLTDWCVTREVDPAPYLLQPPPPPPMPAQPGPPGEAPPQPGAPIGAPGEAA